MGDDIQGIEIVVLVHVTWNHNFDTTMPHGQEMLFRLGHIGREKVHLLKLQNSLHTTSKDIITKSHFKASRVQSNYPIPQGLDICYLYFFLIQILIAHVYCVGMDFASVGIDDLVENHGIDKLIVIDSPRHLEKALIKVGTLVSSIKVKISLA